MRSGLRPHPPLGWAGGDPVKPLVARLRAARSRRLRRDPVLRHVDRPCAAAWVRASVRVVPPAGVDAAAMSSGVAWIGAGLPSVRPTILPGSHLLQCRKKRSNPAVGRPVPPLFLGIGVAVSGAPPGPRRLCPPHRAPTAEPRGSAREAGGGAATELHARTNSGYPPMAVLNPSPLRGR